MTITRVLLGAAAMLLLSSADAVSLRRRLHDGADTQGRPLADGHAHRSLDSVDANGKPLPPHTHRSLDSVDANGKPLPPHTHRTLDSVDANGKPLPPHTHRSLDSVDANGKPLPPHTHRSLDSVDANGKPLPPHTHRSLDSVDANGKPLPPHTHRMLPPLSHGWAYEGGNSNGRKEEVVGAKAEVDGQGSEEKEDVSRDQVIVTRKGEN